MAKKRKSDTAHLDEFDRTMYTTFCNAANSLSQLYSQAMNQQKLAFQAGERQALEKLYQWILQQQEEGSWVTTADVLTYLQNELEHGGEEPPASHRLQFQPQHSQPTIQIANSVAHVPSGSFGPATVGQGPRSGCSDHQAKNSVFSNALSSPIRRSIQHYHLVQGDYNPNNVTDLGTGARNNETNFSHHQSRDFNSSDSPMDMHAESPGHDSSSL